MRRLIPSLFCAVLLGLTVFYILRPVDDQSSEDRSAPGGLSSRSGKAAAEREVLSLDLDEREESIVSASEANSATRPDERKSEYLAELREKTLPTLRGPIARIVEKGQLIDADEELTQSDGERTVRRQLYQLPSKRLPLALLEQEVRINESGEEEIVTSFLFSGSEAMVEVPPGVENDTFSSWLKGSKFSLVEQLPKTSIFVISTPEVGVDAINEMVETVRERFGDGLRSDRNGIHFPSVVPDDSNYGTLWAMETIEAELAWDKSTGSDAVVVGIIDSGVDIDHTDLEDNIWVNMAELNGIPNYDDDNNGYRDDIYGYDFADNDTDPRPNNSSKEDHGTHVAGTVGAVGNNGKGVVGVSWTVKLMALKFIFYDDLLEETYGFSNDAVEAVNYATRKNADLTNNSWGGGAFNTLLLQAIQSAGTGDSLFVAAAGNDGANNDLIPEYPANYQSDNVISVASTNQSDSLSEWPTSLQPNAGSNYGATTVDLAAPGSAINSTVPGNKYGVKSGTSMAAPQVAGALALLKAAEPDLDASTMKARLLSSVDTLDSLTGKVSTRGRLNVRKLLGVSGGGVGVGTSLELVSMTWSDSKAYSDFNNGDGVFDAGETIGIAYTVRNKTATQIWNLSSDIEAVPTVTSGIRRGFDSMDWGNLNMGHLPAGHSTTDRNLRLFCYLNTYVPYNGAFQIKIRYILPETMETVEQSFSFSETVTEGPYPVPVADPEVFTFLDFGPIELFDDKSISPHNNGDGIFSPGETVGLRYTITNNSPDVTTTFVWSELFAEPEEVDGVTVGLRAMTNANYELGPIAPGQTKVDSNLRLYCYGNTPLPFDGSFRLEVAHRQGMTSYITLSSVDVLITQTTSGLSRNPNAFPSSEFSKWLSDLYQSDSPGEDAAEMDANHNGRADLIDFVLGTTSGPEIEITSRSSGQANLSFPLRESIPLSAVRLLYSFDLLSWEETTFENSNTIRSAEVNNSESGGKTVSVTVTGDASEAGFYRLRINPRYTEISIE